jgi:hypothetical protein
MDVVICFTQHFTVYVKPEKSTKHVTFDLLYERSSGRQQFAGLQCWVPLQYTSQYSQYLSKPLMNSYMQGVAFV